MLRKILKTIITIIIALFPLWGVVLIGKYSPYYEGNTIADYMTAYGIISIVVAVILFYLVSRFKEAFVQPVLPGIVLFFLGLVMLGIAGLAAPPDLSIKMLDHPEREHLRYIILFIGALLFGWFFIRLFLSNPLALKINYRWLIIGLFVLSQVELLWEFHHHYHYPEAMKAWLEKGHEVEDFSKHYDNDTVGSIGAIGRITIYTLTLWLAVALYKIRRVNLWCPILVGLLSALGIFYSMLLLLQFSFGIAAPKSLGFLFLFFIPGLPFLVLYWIGTALLTKSNSKTSPVMV